MRTSVLTIAELDTIVVGADEPGALTVALLHGFSMRPEDLAPFAESLRLPVAFLFPRAPEPVPTGGFAWWDVDAEVRAHSRKVGARDLSDYHPAGRAAARRTLLRWLRSIPDDLRARPLVLGGFSQGAMLACDVILMEDVSPAAVVCLSSSSIAMSDWTPRLAKLAGLRGFVSHGELDADLAYAAGCRLAQTLREGGADVTFIGFPQGHEIPLVVWRALRRFLASLCDIVPDRVDGSPG